MRKLITAFIFIFVFAVNTAFASDSLYTASTKGDVPLRLINDSGSYVIVNIPACSKLELVKTAGTWAMVKFRRKCGWINMTFTENTYKEAANNTGSDSVKYVTVESESGTTVLYNIPSSDKNLGAGEKYTVPNGTVLSITRETESGWGLVEMTQKNMAWVKMKDTSPYGTDDANENYGIYYVYTLSNNGAGIPLYNSPEKEEEILIIPDCVKLTVRESSEGIGFVSYGGLGGWIDLSLTTDSLATAQANAGEEVCEEFMLEGYGQDINVYTSPAYEDPESAVNISGTVKPGTTVFVLRRSAGGWGFISHNGLKGWIPPENIRERISLQSIKADEMKPLDLYVMTVEGKGLSLYTTPGDEGIRFCTIPETARVSAVAKCGSYYYVENDYAAGWAYSEELNKSYEKALLLRDEKEIYVCINDETFLKSLPIYSELCGSTDLRLLTLNTKLKIVRTVSTGRRRWGLTYYDGIWGWVNLNCTEKSLPPILKKLIVLGVGIAVLLGFCILIFLLKRKKKGDAALSDERKE